uniref:DUF2451 domain-containing protein n=1 Tax=Gongylonema pulchrum TaxID=637853 RepID=A0A183EGW1_9BILA
LAPVLCNTALNLLRFIGKYIRMTYMLQSVADQAVGNILELCNFFFFTIHTFFTADAERVAGVFFSPHLKSVLDSLENKLFREDSSSEGRVEFNPCTLSGAVQLDSEPDYALPERIVGAESINFISKQLDLIRPVFESLISEKAFAEVEKYYTELYELSGRSVDDKNFKHQKHFAKCSNYGECGKRCSNEGRALMQLDFQQLLVKLEQIVEFSPIPHRAYVENYIKAYYLPESSMETWIQQHSEYTTNQIVTLLNVATHVSKKARTRIINALDD